MRSRTGRETRSAVSAGLPGSRHHRVGMLALSLPLLLLLLLLLLLPLPPPLPLVRT